MADLIDRQAAIDALIKWYGGVPNDIEAFENIIDELSHHTIKCCPMCADCPDNCPLIDSPDN